MSVRLGPAPARYGRLAGAEALVTLARAAEARASPACEAGRCLIPRPLGR